MRSVISFKSCVLLKAGNLCTNTWTMSRESDPGDAVLFQVQRDWDAGWRLLRRPKGPGLPPRGTTCSGAHRSRRIAISGLGRIGK